MDPSYNSSMGQNEVMSPPIQHQNGAHQQPPAFVEDLANKEVTPEVLQNMLAFLRKNGLSETEEALSREAMTILKTEPGASSGLTPEDTLLTEFDFLVKHVESCCDVIQAEFAQLLYPVFVHCYLRLVEIRSMKAGAFFNKFKNYFPEYYADYLFQLSRVVDPFTLHESFYANTIRTRQYVVKMSKTCIKQLELPLVRLTALKNIIKDNITVEQADTTAKVRATVDAQVGGILGQVCRNERRHKMYYGVVKDDLMQSIEKRKMKGKEFRDNNKKNQSNFAPLSDRIPLPALSEQLREDKKSYFREVSKMAIVSPESPVSICMYTTINTPVGVASCDFSDDSMLLAMGLSDSGLHVRCMDPNNRLKRLKEADDLEKIDLETAENVTEQIYDLATSANDIRLSGHGASVFSVNFSPDKRLLLSSSGDKTVRLWSLDTRRNVVIYRTPSVVWDVQFCNRGYYFATGSQDCTAAVWCTDRMQPLRLFADAYGEIGCVDFHPNCNYVVGGSDDRYVRVWDIQTGTCVRTFSGHKSAVKKVKFSPDGRYIASVDGVGNICVWDVAYQRLCGIEETDQKATKASIAFTRDGGSFAVSSGTNSVSVYSLDTLISHTATNIHNDFSYDPKINLEGFNFGTYPTKQTPVLGLHFTRRNLLTAFGCFGQL